MLAIVALTAGLMLPSASRWIDATRERGWRDDLRAALSSLPMRAFQQGVPTVLDPAAIRLLVPDLPASLEIKLSAPLRYGANGVAGGAEITLRSGPGKQEIWVVEPVTGLVKS